MVVAAVAMLLTSCVPTPTPSETPGSTPTVTASDTPAPSPTSAVPTAMPSPMPSPSACPTEWGTSPKTESASTSASITGVRAGRHDCFDRLVIDVDGDPAGYDVRYVAAVTEEGRGEPVDLRGNAFLQVLLRAPAYDPETGEATYSFSDEAELVNVNGFTSFRQVAWGGSFEGQTTFGLGLEAQLPFRVFMLEGPGNGSRVVIDVAH